jgi:hypothetical protein
VNKIHQIDQPRIGPDGQQYKMIRSPRIPRSFRHMARRIGRVSLSRTEAEIGGRSAGGMMLRRGLSRVLEVDEIILEALDRGVDDVDLGPEGLEGGED